MLKEDLTQAICLANTMRERGIIGDYAIGGAIGVIYWTEPFLTKDLDLFLELPISQGGLALMPFLNYLIEEGYTFKDQCILIGTVPVDFVGVYDDLTEEALQQSVSVKMYDVPTRVIRPEHLLAIALKTGRPQDFYKVAKLREESELNENYLASVLDRHGLKHLFQEKFKS